MHAERVKITINNQIATVTLNRTDKKNAFDMPMFWALHAAQKTLRNNRSIRVIILTANGEDFSTGLDIKQILSNRLSAIRLLWKWLPGNANLAQRVVYDWQKIPVPVICAIQGRCYGAALQIALGCDFRIAATDSELAIMEAKWGLIPDMAGNLGLHANVALDQAMRLAMAAQIIDANHAKQLGLISEISDAPLARAEHFANELCQTSPDALGGIKKLYHGLWNSKSRRLLAKETYYQWKILLGKNQRQAVYAQSKKELARFEQRLRW